VEHTRCASHWFGFSPRLTVAFALAGALLMWHADAAPPGSHAAAKYEPPDGTTYHGVCLPGYWNADEFAYPGDDYVDWLAIDVYSSRNPREVIQPFLDLYGKTGKPIMIPEGGTAPEQTRWNKQYAGDAAWVKELFDVVEATPQIKALCWFQWGKEWNVEREPGQLAEYQCRLRAVRYSVPFSGRQDSTRTDGSEPPQ
jgi:hypothetical protein